jgi:hypothetical protein
VDRSTKLTLVVSCYLYLFSQILSIPSHFETILYSSPPSTDNNNSQNNDPSTEQQASPRRVYTTSSTAAAAAGRRVAPNSGRGGPRGAPSRSYTPTEKRPYQRSSADAGAPPQQRSYTTGATGGARGPASDAGGGLPPLTLANPLRLSRIVDQTPGTSEEIYATSAPPRRDGDGGGAPRGGRGSRPIASAGGIGTYKPLEAVHCYRKISVGLIVVLINRVI